MIYVKSSTIHGLGVFSDADITQGDIIESVRAIPMIGNDLADYAYGLDGKHYIGFGLACYYNHSDKPNARFVITQNRLSIIALKNIVAHTEIAIRYSPEYWIGRGLRPNN